MPEGYDPQYYYIDEIIIGGIVFDETENVTILGYYLNTDEDQLIKCDYLCNFSQLIDLLLLGGDVAEEIIVKLSDKLTSEYEIPAIIDIEENIGRLIHLRDIILKIYKPHEKNDKGEWQPVNDPVYYVDSIESKETFEQNPEGKAYLNKQELSKYLSILNMAFNYYQQLLQAKFNDKQARKRAGLKDELLFRIAYFNNQSINE
jgi:hypothetical protein